MIRLLGVIIFTLLANISFAQQPSYFVLGENELANVDVYSLLYTKDALLYAGTDRGLYVYKHGRFRQVPAPEGTEGSSLFHLIADSDGNVYCGNLAGQIFRVENGKLRLFHEVNPKHVGPYFAIQVDDQNRLVYSSNAVVMLEDGAERILHDNERWHTYDRIYKSEDGRINVATYYNDSIGWIENGRLEMEPLPQSRIDEKLKADFERMVELDGNPILVHRPGKYTPLNSEIQTDPKSTFLEGSHFQFNQDNVWIRGTNSGTQKVFLEEGKIKAGPILFPDRFISWIAIGPNEELFLGTFGQGVIFVPNKELIAHDDLNSRRLYRGLTGDGKGGAYLATQGGELLHAGIGQTNLIAEYPGHPLSRIFHLPGFDFGFVPGYESVIVSNPVFLQKARGFSSPKDIFKVNDSCILVAGRQGIGKFGAGLKQFEWIYSSSDWSYLEDFRKRCYSLLYSEEEEAIYVATNVGFFKIDESGSREVMNSNGIGISATDLEFVNDEVWCATFSNGILVFRDGKIARTIGVADGLRSNKIQRIRFHEGKLYVAHDLGFQIWDQQKNQWLDIGTAEGIRPGSVEEFVFSGDRLWMLAGGIPVSIGLDQIQHRPSEIIFRFDSLIVSKRKVNFQEENSFGYSENSIAFHIELRGLFGPDEVSLRSRIVGIDEEWTIHPSNESVIELKSLSPGEYEFQLQATFRGQEEELFTYSFSILPPFWQRWWFLLLSAIFLAGGVAFFYRNYSRRQLREIRRQNELHASKLTAIQSQMNPHFIFNALNSIQDLILQGDDDHAYSYITKFANLVRSTLKYSDKELIDVHDEIQLIELYLGLEKLRYKDKLTYHIDYTEMEGVKIPPMLIQPFIENALVHGIMHKKSAGHVEVRFELGEYLSCIITDDGVGREESRRIRERQGAKHDSFAVSAIKNRFDILAETYGNEVGFEYEDLQEEGKPAGTRVTLKIPVQRSL